MPGSESEHGLEWQEKAASVLFAIKSTMDTDRSQNDCGYSRVSSYGPRQYQVPSELEPVCVFVSGSFPFPYQLTWKDDSYGRYLSVRYDLVRTIKCPHPI
jgi:hypothetical protein